jgi:hypothetical protein
MVVVETFARAPAIDVLCGGWGAAKTEMIPQPASKQILKGRLIASPFHWTSIFCNITGRGRWSKENDKTFAVAPLLFPLRNPFPADLCSDRTEALGRTREVARSGEFLTSVFRETFIAKTEGTAATALLHPKSKQCSSRGNLSSSSKYVPQRQRQTTTARAARSSTVERRY